MRIAGAVVLMALLAACDGESGETESTDGGRPVVYTTFYPTTYFTERIAGDLVDVVCPVPEDEDAIFWEPDPDTIARYQAADLVVVNGAQFEKWALRTSLSLDRTVDTARPFESEWIEFREATTHAHGPAGEHAHEGVDGHTWLDPHLAKIQATEIAKGLKRILPEHADAVNTGLAALAADLDALDASILDAAKGYAKTPILASHPAYNYLARRYGLVVVTLDLDPEAMPDDETFEAVRRVARESKARHILWESEPLPEIARRFREELRVESVLVSPCELMGAADRAAGHDYLSVMEANVDRLRPVLAPHGD